MQLEDLRQQIDDVDGQFCALYLKRLALCEKVAEIKAQTNAPVYQAAREAQVLERVRVRFPEAYAPAAENLYRVIMRQSRDMQRRRMGGGAPTGHHAPTGHPRPVGAPPPAVAAQGIPGAYSHEAAEKLFQSPRIVSLRTFEAVFRAVEKGLCEYGVVPIENSTYGSVTKVYDLLALHDLVILQGYRLPIRHSLLSKAKSVKAIKRLYSHEQAIGQCAGLIEKLGKEVELIPTENTAVAARMAAEDGEEAAALSSAKCAQLFGLNILRKDVQDMADNETRFLTIGKAGSSLLPDLRAESLPVISTCFRLRNEPGTLSAMLEIPASLGANILKLEHRPFPDNAYGVRFFLDLAAGMESPGIYGMLEEMAAASVEFKILGAYKVFADG
ncbi:MAG: chorismate mutase [Oscillospiraceae bacterium]|jgi:chorismate mutase/prephenate dehydratase|nr:chorismate mutase [Oscillospiraceae bacterium]